MFFYATVKLWKCSGNIAATLYSILCCICIIPQAERIGWKLETHFWQTWRINIVSHQYLFSKRKTSVFKNVQADIFCSRKWTPIAMVLLQNGGFCNGCITKRFLNDFDKCVIYVVICLHNCSIIKTKLIHNFIIFSSCSVLTNIVSYEGKAHKNSFYDVSISGSTVMKQHCRKTPKASPQFPSGTNKICKRRKNTLLYWTWDIKKGRIGGALHWRYYVRNKSEKAIIEQQKSGL